MGHRMVSLYKSGATLLIVALFSGAPVSAKTRPEVFERIQPVGKVTVAGQASTSASVPTGKAVATAAKPASEGEALYAAKGCGACHGADGSKTTLPVYPRLVGLPVKYAVNQMKDIKSGARSNGQSVVMKGIIAGVSEEDMVKIAEWLSGKGGNKAAKAKPAPAPVAKAAPAAPAPASAPVAAKPAPEPVSAAGGDGASLYAAKGCAACHGPDGRKTLLPVYPKIAALPVQYALNQMKDIKSGARNNGQSAAMKGIVMGVDDKDLKTIAEWLATQ